MWYSIIMGKQILIIKGSPRRHGNISAMADSFAQGARESGNTITEIALMDKTMGDCLGCAVCQENGGIFFAFGTRKPSDVDKMPVLEEVYEAGKRIERNEVKRC